MNVKRTWNFHTNFVIHLKDLEYTTNELLGKELSSYPLIRITYHKLDKD